MLRFTRSLELTYRPRESPFSKEFCKGLLFATTFHILLFVIFRIALSPNFDNIRPLSPVHIEIDLGQKELAVSLNTTPVLQLPIDTLNQPIYLPVITEITLPTLMNHRLLLDADFFEWETIAYTPFEGLP